MGRAFVVAGVLLLLVGVATASTEVAFPTTGDMRCRLDLGHDHSSVDEVALKAFAQAVRGLEPALPATRFGFDAPVPPEHPLHDAVRYLIARGLLPSSFHPDEFDAVRWQAMLEVFLRGYGLPGISVGSAQTPADLQSDLDRVIERVLAVARPVALLAWEPEDEERLAFVGVVMNWSPYPRLLVMRPPDDWSMRDGARELARRISFCGKPVVDWVSAPAPVAQALFVRHAQDAPMYVVGSEPEVRGWPYRIEGGEELAAFTFEHPEVADLVVYSAVFVADPMGLVQVAQLLPQVRTNLSLFALVQALQTPPRTD